MKKYLGEFNNKDWKKQKREVGDYWKIKEGSKTYWYLQCPAGVMSFYTRKDCLSWADVFHTKSNQ